MLPFMAESTDRAIPRVGKPNRRCLPAGVLAAAAIALLTSCAGGPIGIGGSQAVDIRQQMTTDDRHIASVAMQIAMERRDDNVPSTWTNGMSGNHGAVVPRHTYRSGAGAFCRRYDEVVTVAGVSATFARTACRDGAGRWTTIT